MKKKDRIEILFEKIQSDVKLVLEGHSVLNNKIDSLTSRVGGLENKVDNLEFQMKTFDASLKLLNHEVKELHNKFDKHIQQPAHTGL